MRKIFKVFLLTVLPTAMSILLPNCDTREDWFQKEGEGATFIIQAGDSTDIINLSEVKNKVYNIKLSKIDEWHFYSDTLNLKISAITNKSIVPSQVTFVTKESEINLPTMSWYYKDDGSIDCFYFDDISKCRFFRNDTEADYIGGTRLRLEIKDIFDNIYYCYVTINMYSDCPPMPLLKVLDVDGKPLEKVLSLSDSYDTDGYIKKYEYCIDGNIVKYTINDKHFETITGNWQSGKAAYGGTYITATSLSEVNHAFQEYGEHTVYYRCMDNMGAWSTWKKDIIEIKE